MKNIEKLKIVLLMGVLLTRSVWALNGGAIEPSVVKIVNQYNVFNWYTPWDSGATGKGIGSGFVISKNRIMTNAHVVSDSAMLMVYLYNDPTPYFARVSAIGHDCDLAIIELEDPSRLKNIPALEIAGLPLLRSHVFTYGYPAGGTLLSSTAGVVSRIDIQQYVHSGVDYHLAIQTDAAINPGNSGGPVIQEGKVVGVAFQGNSRLENMGFFIPTEVINHFLEDLDDGSYDGFPELGTLSATLENPAARAFSGMMADETGIRVEQLVCQSSAEFVLKPDDILTHINESPISNDGTVSWNDFRLNHSFLVDQLQIGDTVSLRIIRDGKRMEVSVPLKGSSSSALMGNQYGVHPKYYIYGGLVFVPLNRKTLATYGADWYSQINQELIYDFYYRPIEEKQPFDVPMVMQIRRLDDVINVEESRFLYKVIDSVNGCKVMTLEDLISVFEAAHGDQQVIRYKYGNMISVLDRKKADAANLEILRKYGIPKDRSL